MTEMNKSVQGITSRLNTTEKKERSVNLKIIAIKTIQNEVQRGKWKKKIKKLQWPKLQYQAF